MVRSSPPPDMMVPLTESELSNLPNCPAGRFILSNYDPSLLRTCTTFPTTRKSPFPFGSQMTSTTFFTPDTIPEWYTFFVPASEVDRSVYPYGLFIQHLRFGTALSGHPNKLHGGITSMILDEATGRASRHFCTEGTVAFTANMNVDYKKPIETPGAITVFSWIEEESKGRKQWVGCRMIQEQDGREVVVAEGRCLFLEVPKPASYHVSML